MLQKHVLSWIKVYSEQEKIFTQKVFEKNTLERLCSRSQHCWSICLKRVHVAVQRWLSLHLDREKRRFFFPLHRDGFFVTLHRDGFFPLTFNRMQAVTKVIYELFLREECTANGDHNKKSKRTFCEITWLMKKDNIRCACKEHLSRSVKDCSMTDEPSTPFDETFHHDRQED